MHISIGGGGVTMHLPILVCRVVANTDVGKLFQLILQHIYNDRNSVGFFNIITRFLKGLVNCQCVIKLLNFLYIANAGDARFWVDGYPTCVIIICSI